MPRETSKRSRETSPLSFPKAQHSQIRWTVASVNIVTYGSQAFAVPLLNPHTCHEAAPVLKKAAPRRSCS